MSLSPNDVRNMKFPTTLSGYNKDQVDAFIESVAAALEQGKQESMRLQMELESLRAQLGGMKAFEDTIKNAAIDARRNADMTIAAAKQEGQMLISKAKAEAEQALGGRQAKANEIEASITKLDLIRKSYVAKLRTLITSHLEIVNELAPENDRVSVTPKAPSAQAPQNVAKVAPKPVEKLEVTGSSEMETGRRETITSAPSKVEPIRPEEANAPMTPVNKAVGGDVSEMEALARALKANDAPRPKANSPHQVTDPELAAALARYTSKTEQPADEETMIGRTSVHDEEADTGKVSGDHQEVNVDIPIFDEPADKKTPKDPAMNLARELDEVVARFEEELDKAQKS